MSSQNTSNQLGAINIFDLSQKPSVKSSEGNEDESSQGDEDGIAQSQNNFKTEP